MSAVRRTVVGRALWAAALLFVVGAGVAACGSPEASPSSAPAVVRADDTTRRIALVEFVRQCTVGDQSFPRESDLDADLDTRLQRAGLTHLEWKNWHDALSVSPALVSQLADVGRDGCPEA